MASSSKGKGGVKPPSQVAFCKHLRKGGKKLHNKLVRQDAKNQSGAPTP